MREHLHYRWRIVIAFFRDAFVLRAFALALGSRLQFFPVQNKYCSYQLQMSVDNQRMQNQFNYVEQFNQQSTHEGIVNTTQ